jgi:hypothetical protein
MPLTDHNEPQVIDAIEREAKITRDLLRKLRHVVEQGHLTEPPLGLISELGRHASLLARAIQRFTIRHDFLLGPQGPLDHSEYDSVIRFIAGAVAENPSLLAFEVDHPIGPSEYEIYKDLGFSEREYRDLLAWRKACDVSKLNLAKAFDFFTSDVLEELQAARYSIKAADIVPGLAGLLGIALDVAFFAPTGAVPPLVSSCVTGIAAIAAKFPEVNQKLWERGR